MTVNLKRVKRSGSGVGRQVNHIQILHRFNDDGSDDHYNDGNSSNPRNLDRNVVLKSDLNDVDPSYYCPYNYDAGSYYGNCCGRVCLNASFDCGCYYNRLLVLS